MIPSQSTGSYQDLPYDCYLLEHSWMMVHTITEYMAWTHHFSARTINALHVCQVIDQCKTNCQKPRKEWPSMLTWKIVSSPKVVPVLTTDSAIFIFVRECFASITFRAQEPLWILFSAQPWAPLQNLYELIATQECRALYGDLKLVLSRKLQLLGRIYHIYRSTLMQERSIWKKSRAKFNDSY